MTRSPLHLTVLAAALGCTGSISGARPAHDPAGAPGQPGANPGEMTGKPGPKPDPGMPTPNPDPGTKPPVQPPTQPPAACKAAPARIWPLTPAQLGRTLGTLLPVPADFVTNLESAITTTDGFSNQSARLLMTEPYVERLLQALWPVAGAAAADSGKLMPCLAQTPVAATCVRDFVKDFGARAYRRDLAATEIDALAAFHAAQLKVGDAAFALRELMVDMLLSPSFLYRTELGPDAGSGNVTLTAFEKASALSYFLTDGPPDATLLAAARGGSLDTKAQIEEQTRRLLGKPDAAAGWLQFFRETFGTDEVRATAKDPDVFPTWKTELANDLGDEEEAYLRQVLWGEGGKLSALLTGSFSMLNSRLGVYYGASATGLGTDFRKVAAPAGQRAGLLTTAGFMSTLAKENDTDPVARGKFVREALLCQPLPQPPANVKMPPPPDGMHTQRERLAQHSADAGCAICHSQMDPLGLSFERYDGIGRYRTMDAGKVLDVSGKLTGAEPEDAPFADAVELLGLLARSPDVASCFVATALRYANGRDTAAVDSCALYRMGQRFAGSGGDMLDLAVAITTDDDFFLRATP